MRRKITFLAAPILIALSTLFLSSNAFADVPNSVKVKAAYEGVWQCLSNGAYSTSFNASVGGAGMANKTLSGSTVKLPYGLTDARDNNTNCTEILKGFRDNYRSDDNLNKGLMKSGMWSNQNALAVKNYFAGTGNNGGAGTMGYKAQPVGNVDSGQPTSRLEVSLNKDRIGGNTCTKLTDDGGTTLAGTQSFYKQDGSVVQKLLFPKITKNKSGNWFTGDVSTDSTGINVPEPGDGEIETFYFCNDNSWITVQDIGTNKSPQYRISGTYTQYVMNEYNQLTPSVTDIGEAYVMSDGANGWSYGGNGGLFSVNIVPGVVEASGEFDDYKLTYMNSGTVEQAKATQMQTIKTINSSNAAGYSMSLGASAGYDKLKLTNAEIYSLYTYYIKDVFRYPVICEGESDFSSYNNSNSKKVQWAKDKTCRVFTKAIVNPPQYAVYGVDNNNHFTKVVTIDKVIEKLNALPESVLNGSGAEAGGSVPGADDPDEGAADGAQKSACETASGSLGWIICPVMTTMNNAVNGLYNNLIQPILEVNANALKTSTSGTSSTVGNSSGVYDAWSTFRNYANIAFAIALAIVILSQLTGIGLSNYNVKKILPRLIMVIVLVNISFILCQLAVDISNVLGTALQEELTKMAEGIWGDVAMSGNNFFGGNVLGGVLDVFLNVGVVTSVLGISVAAISNWGVWLIPLLLVAITFVVSVIFFFIILAVRQAGIFILITLAPLAIICYALPNTKSLFDRWYKMFTSLLIVYPICGLMMGGGQFASALLMKVGTDSSMGLIMLLVAVIVSVAPFFLIPTVVKSSMGALGNIGAKLSTMGSKAGGFLGGAFVGSRAGKRLKESTDHRNENQQLNRDKRYLNRINKRLSNDKHVSDRAKARAGRIANRVLATEKDRSSNAFRADQMATAGGIAAMIANQTAGLDEDMERAEVANTLAQYQAMDGSDGGVNFNQLEAATIRDASGNLQRDSNGNVLRDMNDNSLEVEYNRQLDALQNDPEDKAALRRVKALQQYFATQGEPGRAVVQRAFESRIVSGQIGGLDKAASAIARDGKFLSDIKGSGGRDMFAMVNDLASGRAQTGATGVAHYRKQGAQKYDAQALANLDDGARERLMRTALSGNFKDEDLNAISASAREALSNDNIQVKPEQEADLRKLAMAGYAHGASSSATSGTVGSNAMAASNVREIDSAAKFIRSMNGGSKFAAGTNASNNNDYKMIQGMAQNAQTALKDSTKTYSQEQVKAMQDVIKAARDMGVKNDVNNDFGSVDPARIQVRGVEPMAIPTPPPGFTAGGIWTGGAAGPNRVQQAALDHYLQQRAAAESYNREHFGSSTGTGSGSGSGSGSGGTP